MAGKGAADPSACAHTVTHNDSNKGIWTFAFAKSWHVIQRKQCQHRFATSTAKRHAWTRSIMTDNAFNANPRPGMETISAAASAISRTAGALSSTRPTAFRRRLSVDIIDGISTGCSEWRVEWWRERRRDGGSARCERMHAFACRQAACQRKTRMQADFQEIEPRGLGISVVSHHRSPEKHGNEGLPAVARAPALAGNERF